MAEGKLEACIDCGSFNSWCCRARARREATRSHQDGVSGQGGSQVPGPGGDRREAGGQVADTDCYQDCVYPRNDYAREYHGHDDKRREPEPGVRDHRYSSRYDYEAGQWRHDLYIGELARPMVSAGAGGGLYIRWVDSGSRRTVPTTGPGDP